VSKEGEAHAAAWLEAWDGHGLHRTATAGDEAGADWLAREAAALGAAPTVEEFALDRLDPVAAGLEIDGETIPGVPVFDAPASDGAGVVGRLGMPGGGAAIAVAELSPQIVYTPEYRALRRRPGQDALAILCRGEQPGLGLLNAEQFREPYGAPAIHVASEARERVLAAAARGALARLVNESRRAPARGCNVVAALPGRDPARRPVVVMTPRSSWWQSTAERGGGLVCWLETLRALLAAPPGCDTVFTANSGHELGHLGLDEFIRRRPGWERAPAAGGALWVHYGANIGAAGGALSVLASKPDLASRAAAELARARQPPETVGAPPAAPPSGETRDIHRAGGDYLTLVGANRLFHLPQDRWPHAVDLAAVAAIAAAAARLVLVLTR
jgi:hypothetical protein